MLSLTIIPTITLNHFPNRNLNFNHILKPKPNPNYNYISNLRMTLYITISSTKNLMLTLSMKQILTSTLDPYYNIYPNPQSNLNHK